MMGGKKKRPKRRASGKKPNAGRKSQRADSAPDLPHVPDPRAMEKMMARIGRLLQEREFGSVEEANAFVQGLVARGEVPEAEGRTPVERAQDVMYEAWEASGKRRVELARKALGISPDCADAYVLLTEETAGSLREARELLEKGVKAGERALGPEYFAEQAGHFWGLLETRPYMRARAGLAECLWLLGRRSEAIEHARDMLRLNPNDNQGIRHMLLNWLQADGREEEAGRLLEQYEEDGSAVWLYGRALHLFRTTGESAQANAALREAMGHNPHVPAYLLGRKRLPRRMPEFIGWGDEPEAVVHAGEALMLWRRTPAAREWLRRSRAAQG